LPIKEVMDLTPASISAYQQSQLLGQVQIAVAAKTLNIARQQGAAGLQLLQSAGQSEARGGDEMAAAATGLGGALDTYA
jgi:hypothetical protein